MRTRFIRYVLGVAALAAAAVAILPAAQASATPLAGRACYQAHVQDIGWQSQVCDGDIAGTVGQFRRLEGLRITIEGAGTFCGTAHVEGLGWQNLRCAPPGGTIVVGTDGQSLRMEALELKVQTGRVCANAHVEGVGWQGIRCAPDITVGTVGLAQRMEAVAISVE